MRKLKRMLSNSGGNFIIIIAVFILFAGVVIGVVAIGQLFSPKQEFSPSYDITSYDYEKRLTDEDLIKLSQKDMTFDIFGIPKRSTLGVISDISEEDRTVAVVLPERQTVYFIITDDTLIGKAWQEIDEEKMIVRESYDLIDEVEIYDLVPGTRVSVTYSTDKVIEGYVAVEEFIIQ